MATKKVKKDKMDGLTERQKNIIRLRQKLNALLSIFLKHIMDNDQR